MKKKAPSSSSSSSKQNSSSRAFWGELVRFDKRLTVVVNATPYRRLRITQAVLVNARRCDPRFMRGVSGLYCKVGENREICICRISLKQHTYTCNLDLQFNHADVIVFRVDGPRDIHISGYYIHEYPPSGYPIAQLIAAINPMQQVLPSNQDIASTSKSNDAENVGDLQKIDKSGLCVDKEAKQSREDLVEANIGPRSDTYQKNIGPSAAINGESSSQDYTHVGGKHTPIEQEVAHVEETASTSRSNDDGNVGHQIVDKSLGVGMDMGAEQSIDLVENTSPTLAIVVQASRRQFISVDSLKEMHNLPELLVHMCSWLLAKLPNCMVNRTDMASLLTRTQVQETLQAYYRMVGCSENGASSRRHPRKLTLHESEEPVIAIEVNENPTSSLVEGQETLELPSDACDYEEINKRKKRKSNNINDDIERNILLAQPRTQVTSTRLDETQSTSAVVEKTQLTSAMAEKIQWKIVAGLPAIPKAKSSPVEGEVTLELPSTILCPSDPRDDGDTKSRKKKRKTNISDDDDSDRYIFVERPRTRSTSAGAEKPKRYHGDESNKSVVRKSSKASESLH